MIVAVDFVDSACYRAWTSIALSFVGADFAEEIELLEIPTLYLFIRSGSSDLVEAIDLLALLHHVHLERLTYSLFDSSCYYS